MRRPAAGGQPLGLKRGDGGRGGFAALAVSAHFRSSRTPLPVSPPPNGDHAINGHDADNVDDAVLALMHLTTFLDGRAGRLAASGRAMTGAPRIGSTQTD